MGAWDELDIDTSEGPTYWNPQEPEKITGKVVKIDVYKDEDEKLHPQVVLEVDGEEVTVTGFRSILAKELKQVEPEIGDILTIDFQGKAAGKRYYIYRVTKTGGAAPKRDSKSKTEDF
jgi:hypothetical protein